MSQKISRNDPCVCGSNKKYKKCCMNKNSLASVELLDFSWRKLRKTEGEVIEEHLLPYLNNQLPKELTLAAIAEFFPENLPEQIDERSVYEYFFIPWLLFNWIPQNSFELKGYNPCKTIAQNYLETHNKSSNIASGIARFIEAMNQTYYSFYIVKEVVLEKSLIIKDILLGTEHILKEKTATQYVTKGSLVFGRILTLDDQSIFVGMAPYVIPTNYYDAILEYKAKILEDNPNNKISPKLLREYSVNNLIKQYFAIIVGSFNRPLPNLYNTDGDPILFSESYFKLNISTSQTWYKLSPLTLDENLDDFLENAEKNSQGEITKINFPWIKKGNKVNKHWDNTVMGEITIEENRLILKTNSEKRTIKGKKLLSKYLGDNIIFQSTLLQTPEQMMNSNSNMSYDNEEELLVLPEVQEQLQQMAKLHWKSWFDEKIPLLNDRTPREAAKTKDGQEQLGVLLLMYENYDSNGSNKTNFFKADIPYLKKELGLL